MEWIGYLQTNYNSLYKRYNFLDLMDCCFSYSSLNFVSPFIFLLTSQVTVSESVEWIGYLQTNYNSLYKRYNFLDLMDCCFSYSSLNFVSPFIFLLTSQVTVSESVEWIGYLQTNYNSLYKRYNFLDLMDCCFSYSSLNFVSPFHISIK